MFVVNVCFLVSYGKEVKIVRVNSMIWQFGLGKVVDIIIGDEFY